MPINSGFLVQPAVSKPRVEITLRWKHTTASIRADLPLEEIDATPHYELEFPTIEFPDLTTGRRLKAKSTQVKFRTETYVM